MTFWYFGEMAVGSFSDLISWYFIEMRPWLSSDIRHINLVKCIHDIFVKHNNDTLTKCDHDIEVKQHQNTKVKLQISSQQLPRCAQSASWACSWSLPSDYQVWIYLWRGLSGFLGGGNLTIKIQQYTVVRMFYE